MGQGSLHARIIAGILSVACTPPTPPPPVVPPIPAAPASGDPEAPEDTGGPCGLDRGLWVVSAEAVAGPRTTQVAVRTTVSDPAAVAVRCTALTDPSDVHLVESAAAQRDHLLQISGLVPDTSYTCDVAPTCPTAGLDPVPLSIRTGSIPEGLTTAHVVVDPILGMTNPWLLMAKPACGGRTSLVVYDDVGVPRWWEELPGSFIDIEALYDPVDASVVWGGGYSPEGRARVVHVWDGETYRSDLPGWPGTFYHHDAKRIADGRILTLEATDDALDGALWEGFRVLLHDPDRATIDIDLRSQRYVDEGALGPAEAFEVDPYHANWIDHRETPAGPEVYVGLCFEQQILAIDAVTGTLRWQLGAGLGWTVLDEGGLALPDSALPQCVHGPEVDGDRVLMYDNGRDRGFSQAVEWRIDGAARIAQRIWSWTEPGWHEDILGDIDVLAPGRILVTQARLGCGAGGNTSILEVDRVTGSVANRTTFPGGGAGYRAERYDGCTLFASARHCVDVADRLAALEPVFGVD